MIQSQPVHWHRSKGACNDFSTSGSCRTYVQRLTKEDYGFVQTIELASTEHEAIESVLLGPRVDIRAGKKVRYVEFHGQCFATAEVKHLQETEAKRLLRGSGTTYLTIGRPQSAELCISNTLSSSPAYTISCFKFGANNSLDNLSATAPSTTSESWWSPQQPGDPAADLQTLETHASASRSRISGK